MTTLLIILLVFLILGSAFFSSSETALFSLSSMQVQIFRKTKDPRKVLVAKLLDSPRDLTDHPDHAQCHRQYLRAERRIKYFWDLIGMVAHRGSAACTYPHFW